MEPKRIDSYVTYECPSCNENSDMIRLIEVQQMKSYVCWNCSTSTSIKPIWEIRPVFNDKPKPNKSSVGGFDQSQLKEAVRIVSLYSNEAKKAVLKTLSTKEPKTLEELITESIASIYE